jgi:hypothetical protein
MTVFEFRIYHLDGNGNTEDYTEEQFRYVLADTEEEAERKLEEYRKKMVANGYADFRHCANPKVALDNVII